jgi:predicted metalloenzyme YecM
MAFSQDYPNFLDKLFLNIASSKISVGNFQLDHIAYRPLTPAGYESMKIVLNEIGENISEVEDSGRKISIFKLHQPFVYRNFEIPYFELLGPKAINKYSEGYQHVEFVIDCSLEEFIKKYPALSFKTDHINGKINPSIELPFNDNTSIEFHLIDIGEVVRLEELQGGGLH